MSDEACGRYDPNPDDADTTTFSQEQEAATECDGPISPSAPAEGERFEDDEVGSVDDTASGGPE